MERIQIASLVPLSGRRRSLAGRAMLALLAVIASSPSNAAWTVSGWARWSGSKAINQPLLGVLVSVQDESGAPVENLGPANFSFEYYNCSNGTPHQCMYVNAQASAPATGITATPGVYELILGPCCGELGYFTTVPVMARVYHLNPIGIVASAHVPRRVQEGQAFLTAAPAPLLPFVH